jgi:hypothetical protein
MKITISDVGTCSIVEHDGEKLTVVQSGGCPVEKILAGVDFSLPPSKLERVIYAAWSEGYDGDPLEAGLTVRVEL